MAMDVLTTPTITKIPKGGQDFCVNGWDVDSSTAEVLKAAPGAGYSIYITSIILQSNDADANPQIQDTSDTPNILFGPLLSSTAGVTLTLPDGYAIKVASNKGVNLKSAAAGQVSVHLVGKIVKD